MLKVSGNSVIEAAISADQLSQGEIAKVVTADKHVNALSNAVGHYLIRASRFDADGALLLTQNGPKCVSEEHLYHYSVVRMPKGFVLSLEVQ